jgi:hypothetical protein
MLSIHFQPGAASLLSDSTDPRWAVLFEDEGSAGYFYACDKRLGDSDDAIVDGMLIYNVNTVAIKAEMLASIQWSRDGQRAVLYIDGSAQALFDFSAGRGHCRTGFPNFLEDGSSGGKRTTLEWSDAALNAFETELVS